MKFINATLIILSVIVAPSVGQQERAVRGFYRSSKYSRTSTSGGGGHHGGGMGGMGMARGGMKRLTSDAVFVTSTCTGIEGICGLMGPDTGFLVCRTFGERSIKTCIDPNESIAGDVCGCCGDYCPVQKDCATPCDVVPGGVLVNKTRRSGAVRSRCVSPLDAVTILLRNNTVCG